MDQFSLLIILTAALVTPLVMAKFKLTVLPTAVVEILVGILLGPSVLNVVHSNATLSLLSNTGVIFLLFLSGMEIDFSLFNRRKKPQTPLAAKVAGSAPKYSPVFLAVTSYAAIMVTSLLLGFICQWTGLFKDPWLAAIIFMTISLGIVIATLKEKELLSKPFGQTILLIAALGEIVPLFSLTVYASIFGNNSQSLWLLLLVFLAAGVLFRRFKPFFTFFDRINKSTTQLDIRLAFFLIFSLVVIAESVGAEGILGAFVAGIVMKLLQPQEDTMVRLDGIGYGFFIPIFFMMSGADLNLRTLLADPATLLLIPAFFVAYLLAKAAVYGILRLRFKRGNAFAGTAISAATITMVLAVLQVAKSMKVVTSQQSGAFLLAAILTCVLGPLLFNTGYSAEPEDLKKSTVHFIGTNLLTVPVAQQLAESWYDITMYTDKQANFKTYNSEVNAKLLDSLDTAAVEAQDAFDADIVVLGHFNATKNYELAKAAKAYGVKRVIVRFEDRNVLDAREDELTDLGIEVYNTPNVNIAMLRSLIEAPTTLRLLTASTSAVYEVALRNRRYTDQEIHSLPFVKDITISQIFREGHFVRPTGSTTLKFNDRIIFTSSAETAREIRRELGILN
ncbi:MAG: cation:proton antiporter [Levilactobacillus sp.]|jgi:CPA2 family monovalent cation:H+ antiporter-2|uniref:cation:proton antiporter domain-containing protein n=1 Tax=Levilactobacillus sp. TaxID=2767919 RepID=UPI0025905EC7|nr:cation:proton antiporter [Levilactobacillus sp.]MCH4123700.1 cation:proton antiporter [Levilactobacillus sp.]MCI1553798.1 cation:proton antiporter [Levilactobacillus sp.]MCI1599120.1 cation:proton antiporter [Levilactobacillus sp.]MCI1605362.1 cation:proton antiporter [Levilactobacillus sp.]